MLRSLKDLEQYTVCATDGDVGNVVNFLLDDERWVIRYLVVNTGGLFEGRHVLISPISFREVEWSNQRFHLALTVDKIKDSPSVDVDKPVSRQHDREYHRYYGYPYYGDYSGLWGTGSYPGLLAVSDSNDLPLDLAEAPADVHLRSAKEVRGYHIQGSDDTIGHVHDFIVDDSTWMIRYLVIDTSNWWVGKKVLVAPSWAGNISWEEKVVNINLSRKAIKDCPEWNPTAAVSREYEGRLHNHYGRVAYWDDGERRVRVSPPPQHPG